MSDPSNTDHPSQPAGSESCALDRREAIKTFLGIGLVAGLQGCVGRRGPPAGAPDAAIDPAAADPAVAPEAALSEPGVAAAEPVRAAPASEHDHPADGDRLVFAFGDREGQIIALEDIRVGQPQVFAYPMDRDSSHIATESRLGQVMLVRLDPSQLSEDTAASAADGILAYSAICTHTGCEISEWEEDTTRFKCPCHDSEFDPLDNGRVVNGPARQRLAALPLRIEDGVLIVAGGFTGRVGAERR